MPRQSITGAGRDINMGPFTLVDTFSLFKGVEMRLCSLVKSIILQAESLVY